MSEEQIGQLIKWLLSNGTLLGAIGFMAKRMYEKHQETAAENERLRAQVDSTWRKAVDARLTSLEAYASSQINAMAKFEINQTKQNEKLDAMQLERTKFNHGFLAFMKATNEKLGKVIFGTEVEEIAPEVYKVGTKKPG